VSVLHCVAPDMPCSAHCALHLALPSSGAWWSVPVASSVSDVGAVVPPKGICSTAVRTACRRVVFQLAEVAIPRSLFALILLRIERLRLLVPEPP